MWWFPQSPLARKWQSLFLDGLSAQSSLDCTVGKCHCSLGPISFSLSPTEGRTLGTQREGVLWEVTWVGLQQTDSSSNCGQVSKAEAAAGTALGKGRMRAWIISPATPSLALLCIENLTLESMSYQNGHKIRNIRAQMNETVSYLWTVFILM